MTSRLVFLSSSRRRFSSAHGLSKRLLALAAAAVLADGAATYAANYNWSPTLAGPFNWDNAGGQANWDLAGFPNAIGDVANVMSDVTEPQTIDLNQTIVLGALNIGDSNGSSSFIIQPGVGGGVFNFNNGVSAATIHQVAGSAENTIFADIGTAGALNVSNAAATSLVLNGPLYSTAAIGTQAVTLTGGNVRFEGEISDGFAGGKIALVQSGTGTMSLLGSNLFTGGVTLNSGILNIGSFTALGATESTFTINGGTITANSGPIFLLNNNAQVWNGDFTFAGGNDLNLGAGAVALAGSRQITVSANTLIVGGAISDGGGGFGLTKTGVGTLVLAGDNAYSGAVVVSGGVLNIQHSNALGTNSTVTVSAGATLQLQGNIVIPGTPGKTLDLNGEGVGGLGALRNVGGENTWTGNINANTAATIVRITSDSGLLTINGNIASNGTNQLVFQGSGAGVLNGEISGTGPVTRSSNGTGMWTLNGANTYTGNTNVSNGSFKLANANAVQNSTLNVNSANGLFFASGIGTFNAGGLSGGATGSFALTDDTAAPVILRVGSNNASTTSTNAISGAGSILKVGTGALALAGASTFSGGVTIDEGTVTATDATVVTASEAPVSNNGLGTGTVTLLGGNLQLRANGNANAGGQTIVFGNNISLSEAGTINVDRQGGTGSGKTLVLGALNAGTNILTFTNGNGYNLRFDSLVLSADTTLNPTTGTGSLILGNTSQTGGPRILTKTGAGRLVFAGNAGHTGGTVVEAGTLEIATSHGGTVTVNGGSTQVTGTMSGTVNLNGAGSLQIGNGGYAGNFTGHVVANTTGAVIFSRADNFQYGGAFGGTMGLTKAGTGTLVLTGSHSYGAATTVSNGTLMLDYSSSPSILPSTSNLVLAGTLYVKGNSTGTTSQTVGNLNTTASMPGYIVLDNNGGAGTTLTLGGWTFGGSNTLVLDVSRGGTILSNPTVSNGVIVGTGGAVARAVITGTDGRTYFATVSGGQIVPQTTLTPLPTTGGSGNVNYAVSGDVVTTGNVSTGTLRIDTTSGPGSLDLGGNLTFGRTAFLMDGAGDFEIKRTSGTGTIANVVIHQHGEGTLLYNAPIAASGGFSKGGPGLMVLGMSTGAPAGSTIVGGTVRIGAATAAPTGNLTLAGGILELGSGDYTAAIGTANGQVRLISSGGFSAFGATRVVNLGGAGATVGWDQTNFLPNNSALYLSSAHSNATVDFRNPLGLGTLTRTIQVNNGSAAIDAQLSGAIGGSGSIVKTGEGTLLLSAANTFTGPATVLRGGLIVDGSLAGNLIVSAGVLQGNGDGLTTGLIRGLTLIGNGSGVGDSMLSPGSNGIGSLTTASALVLGSDSVFRFELDSGTGFSDLMSANGITIASGSSFSGFDLAGVSTPFALGTSFLAFNNTSFDPISGFFANLADGGMFLIGANMFQANYTGGDGNDLELTTVVPEPSAGVFLLGGIGMMLAARRRRRE